MRCTEENGPLRRIRKNSSTRRRRVAFGTPHNHRRRIAVGAQQIVRVLRIRRRRLKVLGEILKVIRTLRRGGQPLQIHIEDRIARRFGTAAVCRRTSDRSGRRRWATVPVVCGRRLAVLVVVQPIEERTDGACRWLHGGRCVRLKRIVVVRIGRRLFGAGGKEATRAWLLCGRVTCGCRWSTCGGGCGGGGGRGFLVVFVNCVRLSAVFYVRATEKCKIKILTPLFKYIVSE